MNAQERYGPVVRAASAAAAFLALFAVTVRPMFPALAAPLHRNILIDLAVFMSALLLTLAIALRRRLDLRAPAFTAFLLAFALVSALTAAFAEYRYAAVVRALDIGAWCVLAVVLVQLVSTPFRARIVLASLVATLAVLALNGFHQYFVALPDLQRHLAEHIQKMTDSGGLAPSLARTFEKRATSGDVFGTFVISNSFAGYLIVLLPAAFALAVAAWREKIRRIGVTGIVVGLSAVAALVVLFLTKSKGGNLAFVVALAVWAALTVFRRTRGRTAAAAAGVVFAAMLLTGQASPDADNATSTPRPYWLGASAEVRVEYWKASLRAFGHHPILGFGPGNFGDCYPKYRTPEGSETIYAHNDYLQVAVEQGAVGLLVFCGIWAAWFLAMRRKGPKPDPTDEDDPKSRRLFAVVIGAVGVASVLFVMRAFIPTDETLAMMVVGILAWLAVYAVQARHALALDDPSKNSALLRAALMVGVLAFLLHVAIDFDFEDAGVAAPLACALAVGLGLRERTAPERSLRFGSAGQLGLLAAVAVPLALVLVFILRPLIDMSVALEEARSVRAEATTRLKEAADAEASHATETARVLRQAATEQLGVEYPKLLKEAISAWPGNTEPYMDLARGLARANNITVGFSAAPIIERVVKLNPLDPAPWVMMAEAHGPREDLPVGLEAKVQFIDGAIVRYPTQPKFHLIKARLLDGLGRRPEAAEEYRKALDLAERTSEKELKFTPEEVKDIRAAIERLEKPAEKM